MAVINNVYFFYTKIASPVPAFVKTNSEFVVDCVVDKKTAKEYAKKFQKQKPKELDNDEFKAKYKVDEVPFPEQEEQYVIKSKKNHIKDGKQTPEKYFPRVLLATEEGNIDITYDKQVGNGSRGKLSYRETSNDFGVFAELSAILVEDLIEYGGAGGVTADFGAVELKATPDNLKVVQKQEEGAAGKGGKKQDAVVDDDQDSPPF